MTSSMQGNEDTFCTGSLHSNRADRAVWWYLLWKNVEWSKGGVRGAGVGEWKRLYNWKMTSELAKWTFPGRTFLAREIGCVKALCQRIPGMLEATVRTSASF